MSAETIAAMILILWALGIAVFMFASHTLTKTNGWSAPMTPVVMLLMAMAIAFWPVAMPIFYYVAKQQGRI